MSAGSLGLLLASSSAGMLHLHPGNADFKDNLAIDHTLCIAGKAPSLELVFLRKQVERVAGHHVPTENRIVTTCEAQEG